VLRSDKLLLNILGTSKILLEGNIRVLLLQILPVGPYRLLSRLLHRVSSKMTYTCVINAQV